MDDKFREVGLDITNILEANDMISYSVIVHNYSFTLSTADSSKTGVMVAPYA
jgi:hypothetical protein